MKKIFFILMSLLLVCAGVQAKTVRKYLRLSDANFAKIWNGDNMTSNPITGEVSFTAGTNNFSIGWRWQSGIDMSSYTTMTLKLKEAASVDLLVRFRDDSDAYWDVWTITDGATLTAGQTELNITLSNIKHKSDNSAFNFNTLKLVEIHNDANGTTTAIKIDEIYFEKEVTADYTDVPFDVENISWGSNDHPFNKESWTWTPPGWGEWVGWEYTTAQNWSDYKYLAIVPQKQWPGESGDCTAMIYNLTDGTNTSLTWWFNYWSELQRGGVQDLTALKNGDADANVALNNIQSMKILIGNGASNTHNYTYSLSAVYLTNTKPTITSTTGDYVRTNSTDGTCGTICLPYAAAVCGADVYEVVGVDNAENPQTLYLQTVHGLLTAGKAYVFKANGAWNVTFHRASENEVGSPVTGNLQGTFTGADVPTGSYILAGTQWKKVGTTYPKTVGANKAYLTLDNSLLVPQEQASARGYIAFDIEGNETTGINTVNGKGLKVNGYYNFAGQRISQPKRDCTL